MAQPMRLFLLTSLTMVAFGSNSILNRLAVDSGAIDPASFAVLRVLAGAVALSLLVVGMQGKTLPILVRRRIVGAASLSAYMVGFSIAYLSLDAGLGALLLFGVVQVTIFAVSAARGIPPTSRQITGSALAFGGLVWILWPSGDWAIDLGGAAFMVLAGIGWGFYTLAGREEPDALAGTAANFCVALPVTALAVWIMMGVQTDAVNVQPAGLGLAVLSGAVTSGLGYALWYRILPEFAPSVAAIIMLSAPVLAMGAGVVLLNESLSLRLLSGSALVLGGIAWAVWTPRRA